jgi:RNA polymerase sigma factor for flagellar operon FliA
MDAEEGGLWRSWVERRDPAARDSLVHRHTPWARGVARDVYVRVRNTVLEWADFVQNATVGLLEAMHRYDPSVGVEFRHYARHRVRGAVFNGLRREKRPAELSRKETLSERSDSLSEGGDDPLDEFVSFTVGLGIGHFLEAASEAEPFVGGEDPYARVEANELQAQVLRAVENLPDPQGLVLSLHYYQHVPFATVAGFLGVTKGRISQIHRQGLALLRARLRDLTKIASY